MVDLFNCWMGRRIVPLQRHAHPMYKYTGRKDPTRSLASDWEERDYVAALKRITDAEFTGWKPSVTPYEPTGNPAPTVSSMFPNWSLLSIRVMFLLPFRVFPLGYLFFCHSEFIPLGLFPNESSHSPRLSWD